MSNKKTPLDKFKSVQKRFGKTYILKKPWSDYVCGCTIRPGDGAKPSLRVFLKMSLPPNLKLPKTYYGFDIVTEVTGAFRAF